MMTCPSPQPHVVWLMCDQLRADALGFAGNKLVRTPNLDRLAERGVIFDNLFPQASVCVPSRASMITGRYPRTLGMSGGAPLLDPRETTLPEILQGNGYRTGLFGKLHLTPQEYTLRELQSHHAEADARPFLAASGLPDTAVGAANYGFGEEAPHEDILWGHYADWVEQRDAVLAAKVRQRFDNSRQWTLWKRDFPDTSLSDVGVTLLPPELHPSMYIADSASEFFRCHHREAPCFLHVSFVDPHHPFDPPESIARNYEPGAMPLPEYSDCGEVEWPPSLAARLPDFSDVTPAMKQTVIAYYYAMVEMIDISIGRLLEEIERAGQMENTIFIFVSDHGELLGDYGLFRKGSYHYDCLLRVPGFISYPEKLPQGRRISGLAQALDLMPTVLGLLDLPIPTGVQGDDLSGALQAEYSGRAWIYSELFTARSGPYVECWTVRTPWAKLNYYPQDRTGILFDLKHDSHERRDVFEAPEYRDLRHEMTATLLEAISAQTDPLPIPISQY